MTPEAERDIKSMEERVLGYVSWFLLSGTVTANETLVAKVRTVSYY